jgi:HNH endonuclease
MRCQLNDVPPRLREQIELEPNTGCWLWAGSCDPGGYPKTGRGQLLVHRAMYEMFIGGIERSHDVHHICRTRCCVNPAHLVPISKLDHRRLRLIEQTHCKRGHRLDAANVWIRNNGRRLCKLCNKLRKSASHDQ